MIPQDQLLGLIDGLSDGEIRGTIAARLKDASAAPLSGGYFYEPPETAVVELLSLPSGTIADSARIAILAACLDIYEEVSAWLVRAGASSAAATTTRAIRVSNVADATAAPELRRAAGQVLWSILDAPSASDELLRASVRAALSYVSATDDRSIPLWERVLSREPVAAYGLVALLEIDAFSGRIENALGELFQHELRDGWRVDAAALMRRVSRKRREGTWLSALLSRWRDSTELLPDGRRIWEAIQGSLERRSWSRQWLCETIQPDETTTLMTIVSSDNYVRSTGKVGAYGPYRLLAGGAMFGQRASSIFSNPQARDIEVSVQKLISSSRLYHFITISARRDDDEAVGIAASTVDELVATCTPARFGANGLLAG